MTSKEVYIEDVVHVQEYETRTRWYAICSNDALMFVILCRTWLLVEIIDCEITDHTST